MSLQRHLLSKSTYLRGLQCHKSLYLYKHHYHQRDAIPAERQAAFSRGHEVGKLAHQLFPGGKDASPPSHFKYRESVLKTQQWITEGETVIYEAAFQFEQVLVLVDLLVKNEFGWQAFEVKSSRQVSENHIRDAALQYFVIKGSGLDLEDFSIVHINGDCVRKGDLELEDFFSIVSVYRQVKAQQEKVELEVLQLKQVVTGTDMPDISIGPHCHTPYPCDFISTCWNRLPPQSIFNLSGISTQEQFELYQDGVTTQDQIPESYPLSDDVRIRMTANINDSVYINREAIHSFVEKLKGPIRFFSLDAYRSALPLFDNSSPYQLMPFYFSTTQESGGINEFLAEREEDPREQFAKIFLETTTDGTILLFDDLPLQKVIEHLIPHLPGLRTQLQERQQRIVGLLPLFKEPFYYDPAFGNDFSLEMITRAFDPLFRFQENYLPYSISGSVFLGTGKKEDLFTIQENELALRQSGAVKLEALHKILEKLRTV